MTSTADQRAAAAATMAELTGPGGPHEVVEQDVLGSRMFGFKNRDRALHEVLAASVAHGDRDYIVTAGERVTFAEHAAQVSSLARVMRNEYDVQAGDRVAVVGANTPEWVAAFWATVSIGAVAVAFNAWWSQEEMAYALEHTQPRLIIADPKRVDSLGEAVVNGLTVPVLSFDTDIRALTVRYPGAPLPSADVSDDDPAIIVFTSGTSGRPKGVVHTHRNLTSIIEFNRLNHSLAAAFGDPTQPRDRRHLLALPLFHIAGLHNLVVPRLAEGAAVVMYEGRFDADRVLQLIEKERVTNWGAVPTMANRLLEQGDVTRYDTSSLTAFALASAPSTPEFQQRLRTSLPFARNTLANSYGLTETSTGVAVATASDLAEAPGTLGRPVATVQVEVRDPLGEPVAAGVEGEICVRSPFNMLEYWRNEEATSATIRADRWLHTGDIGMLDEQGRVRISSRRSDLIIRGGENVYPAEVEGILSEHPGVSECVVTGVPHDDLGQEVLAVVVMRPGSRVTEDVLRRYAAERLAYFKVPAQWRLTHESLPRNATGKVIRTAVSTDVDPR